MYNPSDCILSMSVCQIHWMSSFIWLRKGSTHTHTHTHTALLGEPSWIHPINARTTLQIKVWKTTKDNWKKTKTIGEQENFSWCSVSLDYNLKSQSSTCPCTEDVCMLYSKINPPVKCGHIPHWSEHLVMSYSPPPPKYQPNLLWSGTQCMTGSYWQVLTFLCTHILVQHIVSAYIVLKKIYALILSLHTLTQILTHISTLFHSHTHTHPLTRTHSYPPSPNTPSLPLTCTHTHTHTHTHRVIQKNLVFVVGLSPRLADQETLRKNEYFGKYGRIFKVVINNHTVYNGTQVFDTNVLKYVGDHLHTMTISLFRLP